jgi:hypothetical protein
MFFFNFVRCDRFQKPFKNKTRILFRILNRNIDDNRRDNIWRNKRV